MRTSPSRRTPSFQVKAVALAAGLVLAGCSSTHKAAPKHTATPVTSAPQVPAGAYTGGISEPVADPYYPQHGNPAIDVLHYGLDLGWAPDRKVLTGTAILAIRAAADTDTVRLDFGSPLSADAVTVDGKPAHAQRPPDQISIPIGRTLHRDDTTTVVIRYHGTPQTIRGPAERKDTQALGLKVGSDGSAVALQEPFGAYTWYPANDQPSDKALYDIAITVPQGWAGVSSGTFGGKSPASDGSGGETYRWASTSPTASYLVAFAVDRFDMTRQTGPGGLPLTYWIRPKDKPVDLPVLEKSPEIISWLEQRLGPYPFPSLGAVVAGDSGMETQQMVTVMPGLPDHVYAHEYTHQWFGDAVTPKVWPDLWLNEGFAMYMEWLYQAHTDGMTDARFNDFIDGMARGTDGMLRAQYGPPAHFNKADFASENAYLPPAIMLHRIRQKVGDTRFWAMMRGWVQEHRNTNQDRASFTAYATRSTGTDLKPLIDAWLDSPTTPTN